MTTTDATTDAVNDLPDYVASCETCANYLDHRPDVLTPEIIATADRRGIPRHTLVVEFLNGLHDRHVNGLSLDAG